MKNKYRYIFSFTVILSVFSAFFGCASENNAAAADVNPKGWEKDDYALVNYYNSDTVSFKDIYVFLVYNDSFSDHANFLDLEISVTSPDGIIMTEDWIYYLSGSKKSKIYSGFGEDSYPYRFQVKLSETGNYSFGFKHKSPESIKGIKAIGIEMRDSH